MDNIIKTTLLLAVFLANTFLIFSFITGFVDKGAQWDFEVFYWLWRLGMPVVLISLITLTISYAQKTKENRKWIISWWINLIIPVSIFTLL